MRRWAKLPVVGLVSGVLITSMGTARAEICNVNFDDPVGIAAIRDAAMTTFVSKPDFYQQGCPGGYLAEVHESEFGFQWNHYHLMYEDECVVPCFPPSGSFYGRDLSCVDPALSGCEDVDFASEPRFLGSMTADHALDVILSHAAGGSTGFCGGTKGACVEAVGELFRPSSLDVILYEPPDGVEPTLIGVSVIARSWTLQNDGTGTVPVAQELTLELLSVGTHDISALGLVDWLRITGIHTPDNTFGSFGVDNLVIDSAECGDGVLDADEACDDGNNVDFDGCPSDCSSPVVAHADADPDDPASKDRYVECDADGVEVQLSGAESLGGPPLFYSWTSAAPITDADTVTPIGVFAETTEVYLEVTDGVYTDTDFAVVWVVDTTPPELDEGAFGSVSEVRCQNGVEPTVLAPPPFRDACDGVDELWVMGTVTASSSPEIVPPLNFDAGDPIGLPVGTHTVIWQAIDTSGNWSEFEQLVDVRPAVYATDSIYVRENYSQVRQSGNVPAAIANSGNGVTEIRNDALTGDVASVARVVIGHRAQVGDVVSETSIEWNPNVSMQDRPTIGSETIGPVVLPPPFDLSSIAFPTTSGQVWVNDASFPPLEPGAYGSYAVNSNGVLRLGAGEYFFEVLTVYSAGRIVATNDTILYVKNSEGIQGPIVDANNAPVGAVLGYAGTTLNLEHDFLGTIVAPNATVNMGTANAQLFRGVIHARVINLQNGADFECIPLVCNSSICRNAGAAPAPVSCENGVQDIDEEGVDCGGACAPCETGCEVNSYEAETMFHSTGGSIPGGWNIWSNGYISASHFFDGGPSRVRVVARGTPANWVWPHMVVRVGGVQVGAVYVTSLTWQAYEFTFSAPVGPADVEVHFDNDLYLPPQDRNLFVDVVTLSCD